MDETIAILTNIDMLIYIMADLFLTLFCFLASFMMRFENTTSKISNTIANRMIP